MPSITTRSRRQSFWQPHVQAWQDSGLSKKRYCREHDLNYQQFIYYCSQSKRPSGLASDVTGGEPPRFVPVAIQQQHEISQLQITLPNGAVISGITQHSVQLVSDLMARL